MSTNWFMKRVVNEYNKLSGYEVEANKLESFRRNLDINIDEEGR